MNTRNLMLKGTGIALLALVLSACGSRVKPESPEVARLQTQLDILRSDQRLAPRAQNEIRAAEDALQAVRNLSPRARQEDVSQRLYLADRRIQIAEFEARSRAAEADIADLERERERLQTEARRREAEAARAQALTEREAAERARREALVAREAASAAGQQAQQAQQQAQQAQLEAQRAMQEAAERSRMAEMASLEAETARERAAAERMAAEQARAEAERARAELEEMRQKLAELEARPTPRGLLLTLGDVLFEVNQAALKEGAARNLGPLVEVLQQDATRNVIIEGHTDSTGTRDYNLGLSLRRAESVRDYLVANGVESGRLSVAGLGPDFAVASNDSPEGRQRNRRVEVIISDAERQ